MSEDISIAIYGVPAYFLSREFFMNRLILATNNRHKIAEISRILQGIDVAIFSADDFDDFPQIEEIGETLEENAILKAKTVWEKYRLPCLADDTGLEVAYLNGAPGVYSSRFAGPGCTYDDNNRKLLQMLEGINAEKRTAIFRIVMAFADENGIVSAVEGTLEGRIAFEPRGKHGFGYDPVFLVGERTLAEMTPDEKNSISHRGEALKRIKPIILMAFSVSERSDE